MDAAQECRANRIGQHSNALGNIAAQGSAATFDEASTLWHHLIHESAHNDIVLNGVMQMRVRKRPCTRMAFIGERRRIEMSFLEHNAVVPAVLRCEPELSYQAMRIHVIDAGKVTEDRVGQAI